jgi:hypothetical protein
LVEEEKLNKVIAENLARVKLWVIGKYIH